jgi:hypothetical protein
MNSEPCTGRLCRVPEEVLGGGLGGSGCETAGSSVKRPVIRPKKDLADPRLCTTRAGGRSQALQLQRFRTLPCLNVPDPTAARSSASASCADVEGDVPVGPRRR